MKTKQSGKKSEPGKTKRPGRSRLSVALIALALAAVVGAGAFLLYNQRTTDPVNRTPPGEKAQPDAPKKTAGPAAGHRTLVGRWVRPDGGYVIEIAAVAADGSLRAAYFNPRPVNISRAVTYLEGGKTKVFIELNDVGYPGATYALIYDDRKDILTGRYYQPTYGQSFEVVFVRTR